MRLNYLASSAAALALLAMTSPSFADIEAAKKWIDTEFQPSTLSKEDQIKEMEWFIKAAEPFKGMEINVLSESIPTHTYESEAAHQSLRGNHRHQGEPPDARRRRSRAGRPDADADQPQSV